MELITIAALSSLLAPFFTKAGETLATESVKLALEKRQDIKDSFVKLFKPDEIITLGLNEEKNPEDITALAEANPETFDAVNKKIADNGELLERLLEVIKNQSGDKPAGVTINAEKIGQVVSGDNHTFEEQTFNF